MSAFSSLASGEDRNVAVDQAVGGMEQGRRIQSPGSYSNKGITSGNPGSTTTSAQDIHTVSQESEKATAGSQGKNISGDGNQGYVNGGANSSGNGTNQAGREQTNGLPAGQAGSTNANTGQGSTGQENGSANAGGGQAGGEQTNGSAEVNTPQTEIEQTSGSVNSGTQTALPVLQAGQTATEQVNNPADTGAGTNVGTGETNTGSNGLGTPTESSGTSSNPIVGVDANVNPESGAIEGGVQTDTSGQLEDRQIIDAGATTGQTSTQAETGSATEITGQETVHQADVTTQPISDAAGQTGTGETSVETQGNGGILPGGSSETTTEGSSGASSNPIVGVDANVNPESGAIEGGVQTDTSGQLEDRQILDAGATGEGTGSTGAEVGSVSDITGQEVVHEADVTTQPVTDATGQTGETTTSVETEGNGGVLVGGATSPTGETGTGEISTGSSSSGTSTEESSGTSSNPIVAVEAGIDQNSGMPNAEVIVDTSGELEEREIFDADLTGETTGSTGAEVGSATDITDADLVEESDITTEVVDGPIPDQISGSTNGGTSSGSQTPAEESSGTSSNPIIDLETNINPESGTADADVDIDTRGEIEDREILAIDLAVEGVSSSGTQTGSASGITGSDTVHDANVTAPVTTTEQTVSTTTEVQSGTGTVSSETQIGGAVESLIPAPSDLGAEIDTTGQTSGGVADAGIAAEVDGVGEGADEASDPADGLSPTVPGL